MYDHTGGQAWDLQRTLIISNQSQEEAKKCGPHIDAIVEDCKQACIATAAAAAAEYFQIRICQRRGEAGIDEGVHYLDGRSGT